MDDHKYDAQEVNKEERDGRPDYKLLMNTAVLAGEIMLTSGAETYRVEDTIRHILSVSKAQTVETVVLMTGIFATIANPDTKPISVIKRVEMKGNNLNRIAMVNEVSRAFCREEISLEEAAQRLAQIKGRQYTRTVYNLATVLISAGFAPLFGGGAAEVMGAGAAGCALALMITVSKLLRLPGFLQDVLSGMSVSGASITLKVLFPQLNMDIMIISAIMPLVPGVAITNAIRDTLQGDYLSGAARMLKAFIIASAIALGVAASMWLARWGGYIG